MSSDQCALDPDGSLKDARDIQWYNDPDDDQPLPPAPLGPPAVSPAEPLGRGRRNKVTSRFADAVARERLRSDDEDITPARPPTCKRLVAPPRATAPAPLMMPSIHSQRSHLMVMKTRASEPAAPALSQVLSQATGRLTWT